MIYHGFFQLEMVAHRLFLTTLLAIAVLRKPACSTTTNANFTCLQPIFEHHRELFQCMEGDMAEVYPQLQEQVTEHQHATLVQLASRI